MQNTSCGTGKFIMGMTAGMVAGAGFDCVNMDRGPPPAAEAGGRPAGPPRRSTRLWNIWRTPSTCERPGPGGTARPLCWGWKTQESGDTGASSLSRS